MLVRYNNLQSVEPPLRSIGLIYDVEKAFVWTTADCRRPIYYISYFYTTDCYILPQKWGHIRTGCTSVHCPSVCPMPLCQQELSSNWDRRPFGHNRHGPKRGGLRAFRGRAGYPSNTMWPEPTSTSIPSGILIHLAVWPQQAWAENGGCASLGRCRWVPI